MRKTSNTNTMKHEKLSYGNTRKSLSVKSACIDFENINERIKKALSAYNDAQLRLGVLAYSDKKIMANYDAIIVGIDKDKSDYTPEEKATVSAALKVRDDELTKNKDAKSECKKAMNTALHTLFDNATVKDLKKDTFVTLHDGYCVWVMDNKKGLMRNAMVTLFKNMGIATEKCNAGIPFVDTLILDAFKAVGMKKVSNKTISDDRETAQYVPYSKDTFNNRMMSHLIDMCRVNGVEI